jgi:hypothetical protein
MTQKSRAEVDEAIAANIPDNNVGGVDPADIRSTLADIVDSVTWHDEAADGGGGAGDMTELVYDPVGKNEQVLTIGDFIDEDSFATNSATKAPSQQSVKAYITATSVPFGHSSITEKATIASPTLTGTPAAPTAAVGTNTTQIATTAYVKAEITSVALTDGEGAAAAIATEMGASKGFFTDDSGDPVYYDVDIVSAADLAGLLAGTAGVYPTAELLQTARLWTVFAPVANVVRIVWTGALNRTITTAAGLTLTFDAVDGDWTGDRLTGGLEISNTQGSTITVTLTNGDGDPDAPVVLAGGGLTFDVTAGDTAIVHYETMANGTVYVVHRATI